MTMENILEHIDLPNDIDVELALIGWVISNNALIASLTRIQPEDFYSFQHAETWKAMQSLYASGKPITPFTIKPLIVDLKEFSEVGGINKYLAAAVTSSVTYPYPLEMEKYLVDLSKKRAIITACRDIDLLDEKSPDEIASHLGKMVDQVLNARSGDDFMDNFLVTERILQALKDERKPVSTGIAKLDEAMDGGFYNGKIYGFAARKKIGKTILAGTISHNLNMQAVKHLFICGEMSNEEIQQRVLSRVLDVYPSAFRTEYGRTSKFSKDIADYAIKMPRNVLYKNAPGLTFSELRTMLSVAVDRHGVRGFILDYWQLVGGKSKSQSEASHLDEVAQYLADFCRKRNVWGMVMAQINQEGNTRGGEGMRLAFDQVYHIRAPEDDPSNSGRYLEMMETRYTKWMNIGSEMQPGLRLKEKGPYFDAD